MKKIIKHAMLIIAISACQIALIPALPGIWRQLNVWLVVLVFASLAYNFYLGAAYGLAFGVILDLYSALPFGAILICAAVTFYLVYLALTRLVTNKSFYATLGLTAVATLAYNLIIYLYSTAVYFSGTKDWLLIKRTFVGTAENVLWQMILNLILASVLFAVFHFSSRRFSAIFIDTVKS